ncbi:Peptidyl-prolyl cis-trans isomerase cyp10 [Bacidia gigantensis]|uniref:Peptidyl-prolyl cis-trans isomerase cyp10 n=1 Tax=Bacidia gigantensis TaxID=2732470 RepID=UPI001D0435DE|nr:Peptidyl-prolyl cis-trans isomerase cyp10 [Bacidia gigantensis]KAG8527682.1 Peptidyl-prolyl cis-trans isomerase cyp10 [Bacidia gigantensis]
MSVNLRTTIGDIKIEVFCEAVPKTAENFLALCASNAYDGSQLHRSIKGFMIQMGSPAAGGPKISTSIWGSNFDDEIRPSLRHNARGIVSMANKGPSTNGSQFFILYAAAPHLDGKNTVFGHILGDESMRVLAELEEREVDKKGRMKELVNIEDIKIHANPLAG